MDIIAKTKKFFLISGDLIVLYMALLLTLILRYGSDWFYQWDFHFYPFTIVYLLTIIVFYIIGLYDLHTARNNFAFFTTLVKAITASAILAITFFYFIPYFGIAPKTNLFLNLAIITLLLAGWRQFYNYSLKTSALLNNILVIGQNKETQELIEYINHHPQLGYRIKKIALSEELKILHDLIDTIVQEKIQIVLTAADPRKDSNLVRNLYQCLPLKISIIDLPAFYEKITNKIPVSAIEEIWFLENLMAEQKIFFEAAKRMLDIVASLLLGITTLVLFPLIALLIKMGSSGPILTKQKRVGRDSRIFELVKFRTMLALAPDGSAEKAGAQWSKEKDDRITRIGKWLRKTRLDELPQVWNVLKSEMSFVGPRPERPEFAFSNELLAQIPFYQIRHVIKPGLTGWAQIKYPYASSVEDNLQKLQYDLYYIKNRSFVFEIAIILKTIKIILSGGGR